MTEDIELSDDERAALARLKQDVDPPPHIERAVVSTLKRNGLVADPRRRWLNAALVAAAVLAGFIAGTVVRRQPVSRSPAEPQFVLLLYAGDDGGSPPSRREEYTAWARSVAARGTDISGLELIDSVDTIVTLPTAQTTPAQPRGFFVVHARDLAEARRIAETCPHLQHGGRIVLRRAAS